MKRRCVYNKDTCGFTLDYGLEFLKTYKDDKKVLYLEFTDAHEPTSEVVRYMDDYIYDFLKSLQDNNLIQKNTIMYILSDHGQHLFPTFFMNEKKGTPDQWEKEEAKEKKHGPYKHAYSYHIERMLPVFQMYVSGDILAKNP